MFLARKNKVIAHRELWKNLQQLECPAHAQAIEVARAHACRQLVVDAHLARARLQLAEHAIEQRGFSRPVRSDDAEDFSGTDFKRNAVNGNDAAEGLAQVGDFEHRGHVAAPSVNAPAALRGARNIPPARSISPSTPAGQNAIITMTAAA